MQIEAKIPSASESGDTITESPPDLVAIRPGGRVSSIREVAVVQADYVALANDLEQANALSTTLELQLSGKCNELAQFKRILERTKTDMQKFEHDLEVLRRERHTLANQVQRSYALESEFEKLKRAHEQLKSRSETLESELGSERVLHTDARRNIAELKDELEQQRRKPAAYAVDADTRIALEMIRKQIDRVLEAAGSPRIPANAALPQRPAVVPATSAPIEITFES